eukprot:TRINITY_DN3303_c0_g1_i2.p1 TRINITY_DN3303_c0_g1~~TRINITY_DN3303_c0_g1_i2.p1  ORF type:complete len:172 (-),score=59.28 TRINITY_DN3303_c0_g1_i2:246-761(-)
MALSNLVLLALALIALPSCMCEDADSPVVEVTMENFVEVVTDGSKHVLVLFYAPWCGECKTFASEYAAMAESSNKEDVVVAQMDGEAQAVFAKMYKVESFPTIKLFSKKEKKGIAYDGALKRADIESWLEGKTYEEPQMPAREPPKIITREDGTIEMTETFYHYGDGMPPI